MDALLFRATAGQVVHGYRKGSWEVGVGKGSGPQGQSGGRREVDISNRVANVGGRVRFGLMRSLSLSKRVLFTLKAVRFGMSANDHLHYFKNGTKTFF